nr:CHAT domain-containing protein [uncultured Roseateles sp.]
MSFSSWTRNAALFFLALLGAVSAAAEDPGAILEKACAAVPAGPRLDLDALNERINEAQRANRAGLEDSCLGWRQVMRDAKNDLLLLTEWQAMVASSLVWLGRSAEAEPLFDLAYQRYGAAGSAYGGKSSKIAAMLAVTWLQKAQMDTALQWSQRAVDAAGQPESGVVARDLLGLRLNHASMLSRARHLEEAKSLLLDLLAQAEAQPELLANEAASALNSLASLTRRQSRLEEALDFTEREIALRQARVRQDPVNIATAMHNRGLILMNLARFDEAEAALQAALQQAQAAQASGSLDLMGHQASVRETLSGLLLARGRPDEALKMAEDAVAALAGRPEAKAPRGARPLRRLAEAQLALGELGQGVATYRRALVLLGSTVGAPEAETALALRLGFAVAMIEIGDLDEADASLQQVDADKRPRSPEENARYHSLQAALAQRRGDAAAAARAWLAADQALAATLPPEHPERQFIQTQACELQAAPCPALSTSVMPNTQALTQMSLLRRARAAGDSAAAQAAARLAVEAAFASGQPRLQWQALALWAEVQADAGQRSQAIFLGKLALSQLQRQRERLLPLGRVADARYLVDKAALYRRVADWLLQAQRLPEALEVMRLLKVQEQADFNERGSTDAFAGGGVSLSAAEQSAWQRFESSLQGNAARVDELRQLSERAAAQRITAQESARLAQLRRDEASGHTKRLVGLSDLLVDLNTPARPAAHPIPGAASGVVQRPPPGQLYAYTLAGAERLSLLLVNARGTQLHQLDIPAAELAQQVAAMRDALSAKPATDAVRPLAEAMYSQLGSLIDKAARQSGARQIVVWLDGPLRYLPLGLMHDGRRHLAERYQWIVAGGLASPLAPTAKRSGVQGHVAAFGVTQALQGLPALPAVADELCDIVDGPVLGLGHGAGACGTDSRGHGPLRGQGWLNALFTEASLTRAGADAAPGDLLHIGTHFVLRPGSVAKSWLLLGDGSRLPLDRMRRMNTGTPRLVTLSACETATVDAAAEGAGREVDGLAVALLGGGASQVLASLWRVDDRATARFMQRFYAAYARQRGNAALALQLAQQQAIAEGSPARDWASFVLMSQMGGIR